MVIQASFPNFRVENKAQAIEVWAEMLKDVSAGDADRALAKFIMTDTKGFAPSIGQLRALAFDTPALPEGEAWNMVYKAVCNSGYYAQEEFNKLPDDVRRAVGGASTLRTWAMMDMDDITVAESNFKRSYRAVVEARQKYDRLPERLRPQIAKAPDVMIEGKEESASTERADPETVAEILSEWRERNGI